MNELKTTTDLVKYVLEAQPQTRDSDNRLYISVLKILGAKKGFDIDKMSITRFLLHMKEFGIPSIETVGRCRRKIVEIHPELAGSSTIEGQRRMQEEMFREYAKKVNV